MYQVQVENSYGAYYLQGTKNPLNTFKKKLDTTRYTNIPRFRTRCNVFAGALIHSADSADSADFNYVCEDFEIVKRILAIVISD